MERNFSRDFHAFGAFYKNGFFSGIWILELLERNKLDPESRDMTPNAPNVTERPEREIGLAASGLALDQDFL